MTKRMALLGAALAAALAGGALTGGSLWASDASLAEEGGREYAAGNFAKALEIYDEALKSAATGNRAPLLFNRANALYRLGRLAEAEEAYREAAAADGGLSRDSAFNQGNAAWQAARALQEKEPQKALEGMTRSEALFRRALEQAPGDPDSAYNLDLVRREIHKLRQRLPPPQGQPQQNQDKNQNKNQDKKQGDQQDKGQQGEQRQSGQKDQQDGQPKQGNQNPAQGGQDKTSPNQQGQQGERDEPKGGQNGQQNEPKDGAQSQKQPNGQGPQGDEKPQANPKGRDGERGGGDGKESEKKPAGQGQDEAKDGQNGDQDRKSDDQSGQDAPKGDQGERIGGKKAAPRQPGDETAQVPPRGQDDRAAKTAEQILQREKEDREKRAKARRRQAPVEKDW